MKRRAPYDLDRSELERNNYDLPDAPAEETPKDDAPVDLSKRRIVKLRNPSEVYASKGIDVNQPAAGKFTLAGSLETGSKAETGTEQNVSFLAPTKDEKPAEKPITASLFSNVHLHKETEAEPSQNLWGNKTAPTTISASLFMNNDYKKQEEPAKKTEEPEKKPENGHSAPIGGGLFDNRPLNTATTTTAPATGGLFGKPIETPSTGLFGNAGASVLGGTLFQQTEKKPEDDKNKKPSLFASLLQEVDPKEGGGSLFSNYLNTGNQTFEDLLKRSTSTNIFAEQKADDEKSDDDEGEGLDDDEPQRSNSPEPDATKTTSNYKYEEHFEKITFKPVEKFKVNDDADTKTGTISLEKSKSAGTYHVVFRDTSKVIRFQGMVFKNLSRPKHIFENKPHTLSVICYTPKAEGEAAPEGEKKAEGENKQSLKILSKFNQFVVKLMFPRADECIQFKEAIEKALA